MGHFPVGMEYFPASKTKQFELIRNLIDEADYYVLVIGSRYGTINDDTGNSFTHDEFLYAKDTDKPILAFIQEQKASPNQEGTQDVIDKKLKSFIDEVEYKRTCCIWSDRTELLVDILTSLYAEFENHPQLGWAKNIAKGVKNVADVEVSSVPAEVKKTNVGVAWEKFSGFINFDTETLESIYKEVVNELNSQTYFTTVPLACITYVFAYLDNEETIELTEEVKTALLEGYHKTLSSIMYREDLYDARLSFLKTLNYQKEYGEELKKLNELIKAFREEYDRQWNSKSDKMTYALLHLTDENVNQLTDIQRGALPDHSTTYWWTSIFGGVNVDTFMNQIKNLSDRGRRQLSRFLIERYELRYNLQKEYDSEDSYKEDKNFLEALNKKLSEEIITNNSNSSKSFRLLNKMVEFSLQRLAGETKPLL